MTDRTLQEAMGMTATDAEILARLDFDHQVPCECPHDEPASWQIRIQCPAQHPNTWVEMLICDEHYRYFEQANRLRPMFICPECGPGKVHARLDARRIW